MSADPLDAGLNRDRVGTAQIELLLHFGRRRAIKSFNVTLEYGSVSGSVVVPAYLGLLEASDACSHDRFEKRNHRAVVHQRAIAANVNEPRFRSTVAFVR